MAQTIFLYPWQEQIVNRQTEALRNGNLFLNTGDLGVGKCLQAAETAKRLQIPYVVLAPKATLSAWRDTIRRLEGPLPQHMFNIERLQHKNPVFDLSKWQWHVDPGTLLIVDEIHMRASGPKSKTTLILMRAKLAGCKLLATSGTIADSPLKLRVILFYAGLIDGTISGFYRFCRQHGCYSSMHHNGLEFVKGPRAIQHMRDIGNLLADKMGGLKIESCKDFPQTLISASLFDIEEKHRKRYAEIDIPEEYTQETDSELVQALRIRQIVECQKIPILADLVRENYEQGHVSVVFVAFRFTMFELEKELSELRVRCIYGGLTDAKREEAMSLAKQDQLDVVILTIDTGVGINLNAVPGQRLRNSFLSPSYSSSACRQALGRLPRTGGLKSSQLFVLIAGTIEEKIYEAINRKLGSIDAFNSVTDQDLMGL